MCLAWCWVSKEMFFLFISLLSSTCQDMSRWTNRSRPSQPPKLFTMIMLKPCLWALDKYIFHINKILTSCRSTAIYINKKGLKCPVTYKDALQVRTKLFSVSCFGSNRKTLNHSTERRMTMIEIRREPILVCEVTEKSTHPFAYTSPLTFSTIGDRVNTF